MQDFFHQQYSDLQSISCYCSWFFFSLASCFPCCFDTSETNPTMTSSISSSHGWAQTLTSWNGFFVVFDLLSSFASCHAWRKSCGDFSSFVPARKKIFMQILIGLSVILPRHFLERQASKGSNLLVSCPCLSPFLFPFPDSFPSHAFPAKTAALKLPFFLGN